LLSGWRVTLKARRGRDARYETPARRASLATIECCDYLAGMNLDELLRDRARHLVQQGLFRDPTEPMRSRALAGAARLGLPLLDASSNDYLGFAARPVSRETSGSGASRLLGGTREPHQQLEAALAHWIGAEAVLLFSSGYAANVGAVSALAGPGEAVLSDSLNHASIIDGCRLSRASVRVFPHRDLAALRDLLQAAPRPAWVMTESYFSMEGTSPDLGALRALCDEAGAFLVVDEAHALGVFGSGGRGGCQAAGVRPDVLVGMFGKAFGVHGGFVAGSLPLRDFLWNRARSVVFSTATSPALAATLRDRLPLVAGAEAEREHLRKRCAMLDETVRALGLETPRGRHGPIFPILLGDPATAQRASAHLADWGILAPAVRPPTVPDGTSRLRLTVSASFSPADVSRATDALQSLPRP
jgi:8-amino-7-oxononanoate synthase